MTGPGPGAASSRTGAGGSTALLLAATALLGGLLLPAAPGPALALQAGGGTGAPARAGAGARAAADTAALPVPDVPFVAQDPDLCGGAAVAMALRYWGRRGVHAEDFRPLVTGRPAGIRTTDLLAEIRERGGRARLLSGSADAVARHLRAGRPVIALIRVAPRRYHYVVLLAVTPDRVLFHDPARGPYRVMGRGEWREAWAAADRWAALVTAGEEAAGRTRASAESAPPDDRGRPAPTTSPDSAVSARDLPPRCASLVRAGVRRAREGRDGAASAALRAAAELCPARPEPWAELAGLRFSAGAYREAARLAERAAARAGGEDPYPWRLFGTARYLTGDARGALRAWNRLGEPAVDHVRVQGLRRTRHRPALDLLDLEPGSVLTPGRLLRGSRRLSELPALRRVRVDYRALEGLRAEVRAAAWERRLPTASPARAAAVAARGLADRTVRLSLPSPTGGGGLVSAGWRWTSGRPRLELEARAPSPVGAVWGVEGYWERQSYAPAVAAADAAAGAVGGAGAAAGATSGGDGASELVEERRGAVLSAAEWLTGRLRGRAALGLDRWSGGRRGDGGRRYLRAGVGATWRSASGRWKARARASGWAPLSAEDPTFGRLSVDLLRRLGEPGTGVSARLRAGLRRASGDAPLALWPGAGTGRGRSQLLRAHPLLDDGRVVGPAFGRTLVHGGAEATAWVLGGFGPLRAGVAGFVDAAAAGDRPEAWPGDRTLVDAGGGLRLRLGDAGTVRLDAAAGLRDGRTALSAGWVGPVP